MWKPKLHYLKQQIPSCPINPTRLCIRMYESCTGGEGSSFTPLGLPQLVNSTKGHHHSEAYDSDTARHPPAHSHFRDFGVLQKHNIEMIRIGKSLSQHCYWTPPFHPQCLMKTHSLSCQESSFYPSLPLFISPLNLQPKLFLISYFIRAQLSFYSYYPHSNTQDAHPRTSGSCAHGLADYI